MRIDKYNKFLDLAVLKKKDKYFINEPYLTKIEALVREQEISEHAHKIVIESLFISLVTEFDAFILKFIKILLHRLPSDIVTPEKNLTVKELNTFGSISDAVSHILESEAEDIMRESHGKQMDWFKRKFNISLETIIPLKDFIEITERRNLFVHSEGLITAQYLRVCSENGIDVGILKKGDKLEVTQEYFYNSYYRLFETAIKISQVIWRKVFPKEFELADENLINMVVYELLKQKEFSLVQSLCEFALTTLKDLLQNEQVRKTYVVNLALSYKRKKNKKMMNETIHNEDWSASNEIFHLAVAVLNEDYDLVSRMMEFLGSTGKISKESYVDWPLFEDFRKTTQFSRSYKKVFGEEYRIIAKRLQM